MERAEREFHAKQFNTPTWNVRTWNELTDKQMREAECMFFGNSADYVYMTTTYGNSILARRKRSTFGR